MAARPQPRFSKKDRWPQWCDISAENYADAERFEFEGTPVPKRLYPFGEDDGTGKPIRIPCREVIIFQTMGNPNSLYPADHVNAITREVRIYIELPADEIRRKIYPHQSWIINVYDGKGDATGRSYLTTRASIHTVVNPHIEFLCAPQE